MDQTNPLVGLRILVSGGTGFLGQQFVPRIMDENRVTLLSRQKKPGVLQADLTLWNGGLDLTSLKGKFDVFIHLAGLYDLRAAETELMRQNVFGTQTALTIAEKAQIPLFVHASTVAVTINQKNLEVDPQELDLRNDFPDSYARSKALAEDLVRNWKSPMKRVNLRLGILVGSTTGEPIHRIDGPYHAPEALRKLRMLINLLPLPVMLPGNTGATVPMVPVDVTAKAMVDLLRHELGIANQGEYKSYHLAPARGTSTGEIYDSCFKYLAIRNKYRLASWVPNAIALEASEILANFPREELTYLLRMPKLSTLSTQEVLGNNWCPTFSEYQSAFWKGYTKYVSNR